MPRSNYIGGDYTEKGYISAKDTLIPLPCRFRYRPALIDERAAIFGEYNARPLKSSYILAAKVMAAKIKEWDIKDQAGKDVLINEKTILDLQVNLFITLQDIVFGYSPSEIDPLWTDEEKDFQRQLENKSIAEGTDVGILRESETVKN